MSDEFSHLSEQVSPELLDAANTYTLVLMDGMGAGPRIAGNIHYPAKVKNPYQLDLTQFIPNPPVTYEGFVTLLDSVIQDAQAREGVVATEQVKMVQEYNPEFFPEFGDEIISFKLSKRYPAFMSKDGKSRPNRGWTHGYEYINSQEPNKVLCVDFRPIDHNIQLTAWGKTATLANSRALWLERLLVSHRWVFTSKGVKPFNWEQRGADTVWTHQGTRLHQRTLDFKARLSEYTIMAYPTLREFELHLKTEPVD